MSDVIQRLLDVEKDARRIIYDAEQEAAAILSRANDEVRAVKAKAREDARRDADQFLQQTADELSRRYEEVVAGAKAKLPSPESLDPQDMAAAVGFVVGAVSGLDAAQQ